MIRLGPAFDLLGSGRSPMDVEGSLATLPLEMSGSIAAGRDRTAFARDYPWPCGTGQQFHPEIRREGRGGSGPR